MHRACQNFQSSQVMEALLQTEIWVEKIGKADEGKWGIWQGEEGLGHVKHLTDQVEIFMHIARPSYSMLIEQVCESGWPFCGRECCIHRNPHLSSLAKYSSVKSHAVCIESAISLVNID